MSHNYHTPIPTGAAANAATFNDPLGQMDEALSEALMEERDGHIIQDEGVDLAQRARLNFAGQGVNLEDTLGVTKVNIDDFSLDGFGSNYQLVPSIATNNLTVALKDISAIDPSATSLVRARIGNTRLVISAALSVTITAAMGDIFGWDSRKIQGNDAQLFVYLINNNGTPQLGVSPCPTLTTVATDYRDAVGQRVQLGTPISCCLVPGMRPTVAV